MTSNSMHHSDVLAEAMAIPSQLYLLASKLVLGDSRDDVTQVACPRRQHLILTTAPTVMVSTDSRYVHGATP